MIGTGSLFQRIERLQHEAARQQREGRAVEAVQTNFPKHPPAPGVAYSKNFARALQMGRFAVQERT